ncbi:hypothetical protein RRG08_025008 [Elysia crispata]|uniref:Uncharacterized protein n=1 Tax=Elysia crispata TaxID=231223 RepID=A0AAE1ANM3_9GAST|nr:hypothetical protein RRG08_025008 [Elysia crispata]
MSEELSRILSGTMNTCWRQSYDSQKLRWRRGFGTSRKTSVHTAELTSWKQIQQDLKQKTLEVEFKMAWTLILGIRTEIDFSKRNRFDEIGSPAIKTPVIKILMGNIGGYQERIV